MQTLKFWRLALTEVFNLGFIKEKDFIKMYEAEFYKSINTNIEDKKNILLVIDVMRNTTLFSSLVKKEIKIITKTELPETKKKFTGTWLSYLLECYECRLIDLDELNDFRYCVLFDNDVWDIEEIEIVEYVINKLRLHLLKTNPNGIDYIENPTFDMLMSVNEIGYVND